MKDNQSLKAMREVEELIIDATIQYGELQNKIDLLKGTLSTTPPRNVPSWISGKDEKSAKVIQEISRLEKSQEKIKTDTSFEALRISQSCDPETKKLIRQRIENWSKSDIAKKAIEIEQSTDKNISEVQKAFSKKFYKDTLITKFAENEIEITYDKVETGKAGGDIDEIAERLKKKIEQEKSRLREISEKERETEYNQVTNVTFDLSKLNSRDKNPNKNKDHEPER